MALGRNGARRIVVDGTAYRWRRRSGSAYFQALSWTQCTFAVEHADAPGERSGAPPTSHIRATSSDARPSMYCHPTWSKP